jgi:hypothetical protein
MPIICAFPRRILVLVRAFIVRCTQRENVPGVPGFLVFCCSFVVMSTTLATTLRLALLDS